MPWVAAILPTRVRYSSMISPDMTDFLEWWRDPVEQARTSPNPLSVPSGVAKLCAPEFRLVRARMRAPKCNAAWECPPSRGRATNAREKESPLPVYDPKVKGR
ncbi:hypothetical protein CRG98_033802 [Punica granatum]|uniref:Uncharacterized protein n=1 Tax=Punica granatum TaxID=22663 RepID=A0A2I0IP69_PUNGR|nr:hypothetical protein CRG98_033802 [Punica granatum]